MLGNIEIEDRKSKSLQKDIESKSLQKKTEDKKSKVLQKEFVDHQFYLLRKEYKRCLRLPLPSLSEINDMQEAALSILGDAPIFTDMLSMLGPISIPVNMQTEVDKTRLIECQEEIKV